MNKREALEILMLLSALESWGFSNKNNLPQEMIDALTDAMGVLSKIVLGDEVKQSTWIGLTDRELAELSDMKLGSYDLCLEVEAKLLEKNHAVQTTSN